MFLNRLFYLAPILLTGIILLGSCNSTKHLAEDEYLLKKNKVEIITDKKFKDDRDIETGIESFIRQKPNSKQLFFFRIKLWFYNIGSKGKQSKFKNWMRDKLGEPPVVYDSTMASRSTSLIESYMQNKGYFYADAEYDTKFKKQKATVTYKVYPKVLYHMDSIYYPDGEERIDKLIQYYKGETDLEPEMPFDVDALKAERERIAEDLRNEGYYYFNKEFVYYDLDSSDLEKKVDVYVRVKDPTDSTEHQVYYINNVYIFTDYTFEAKEYVLKRDTVSVDEYHVIAGQQKYKPKVLINAIFFKRGEYYKLEDNRQTVNALADLGVFKFINVEFEEVSDTIDNLLNVLIYLTPSKKQEMSIEVELNNSTDYDLGTAATYTYRNKNIFKGAELFSLNVTGGVETQFGNNTSESFLNTVDFTTESSLYFNRFLVPFNLKGFSKYSRPKTRISFKYSYQRRIDYYTINSYNAQFGYDWKETATKRHLVNPISINRVQILDEEPAFTEILNRSPVLKASFEEQLILGANYTYIFTNQLLKEGTENFFYLKTYLDIAGNLTHGIMSLINSGNPPYEILNTRYAQYVKGDVDYRYYFILNESSTIATRIFAGAGYPYGNAEVLPYIKQYFIGGSNSIRAWRVRTLGPGSFHAQEGLALDSAETENIFLDQTGDMRLEGNVEYRFDIFRFFKGALFVDAGNIWLIKSDSTRPQGLFNMQDFYQDFAVGTGFGVRLDFNFFVLRFDVGFKTRDPGLNREDRWVIKYLFDKEWKREYGEKYRTGVTYDFANFNISIGYPF